MSRAHSDCIVGPVLLSQFGPRRLMRGFRPFPGFSLKDFAPPALTRRPALALP
jgi:hypothetical protein